MYHDLSASVLWWGEAMRRTEQAQGLRLMKFEEVYARTTARLLSQAEAAEVLGVSERTFRRWRDRYEAEGAEGLYDRRLGRLSARRAPLDEVARVLALFDTRYWDFTAKHFHEKLVAAHGERSYNWVRLTLQAHGRRRAAPRRGAHRRKRPRRALPGMMVHQDGSRHAWVPGRWWDLIVTMDDATSTIYSAFFVDEEGTMSSFRALSEVIAAEGLFGSLYADRATHYWHTPEAGGKVDKDKVTQVGRALMQLGIELIPAYSPEARGAVRAHVRHPAEAPAPNSGSPASPTWPRPTASSRSSTCRSTTPASPCRPREGSAFVPFAGALDDILCVHADRVVGNDNTVRYRRLTCRSLPTATDTTTSRQGSGCTSIPTAHSPSSTGLDASPATTPTVSLSKPQPGRPREPLRRDRPMPCQVDSRAAPDHFPTGPSTTTEAVNSCGT